MKASEIEQCRQKLLRLRAELQDLEGSSKDAAVSVELDQADRGLLSRKDAMQALLTAQEGSRRRKRQLQKIDGALRRIEAGEYGRCFVCEEELDAGILSVDPTTTRCMNCVDS